MKKSRLAAVAASITLVAVAQLASAAKGPEYTYAELGYINIDGDAVEGDGAGANISFGATDHIFLKFGYSRLMLDEVSGPLSADGDRFQIGGGMHYGITDSIDVLGAISYVDIEFTNTGPVAGSGEDGYLAELGVRAMVTKELELNATVSQLHLTGDSDTGYGAGVVYSLNKDWSLVGSYRQFQDDSEGELFAGVRVGL
jgi:hypothetical protein